MYEVEHPIAVFAVILLVPILIAACGNETEVRPVSFETTNTLKTVKGLQDCQAFIGRIEERTVTIIRCPNSSTSTTHNSGKQKLYSTTIDESAELNESKKKLDYMIQELIAAQKRYEESIKN